MTYASTYKTPPAAPPKAKSLFKSKLETFRYLVGLDHILMDSIKIHQPPSLSLKEPSSLAGVRKSPLMSVPPAASVAVTGDNERQPVLQRGRVGRIWEDRDRINPAPGGYPPRQQIRIDDLVQVEGTC